MKNLSFKKLTVPIILMLLVSLLSISIGFASLSTTLTVNGSAAFTPTDLILVTNISEDTFNNATLGAATHTTNAVNAVLDLDTINGYATYNVTIRNYGNVDKVLSEIDPEIFSNADMKYEVTGISEESIIRAHDSITFKVTFRYRNDVSTIDETHLNARIKFIFENYVPANSYTIIFDANGGSGAMNSQQAERNQFVQLTHNAFHKEGYIFTGWNTKSDGTGTNYHNGQSVKNINGANNQVTLYAQWSTASEAINYEGECEFNGQGTPIDGNCNEDDLDYLRTDITPFSEAYYQKSFELSFKISSVDSSNFASGYRATIFNMLYENQDNTYGRYPGILLRTENGKWLLQVGDGSNDRIKKTFERDELIGKELKLIRHNDGNSIKVYYLIDGEGPYFVKDITNLVHTFDTPLTFGANLTIDNVTTERYAIASLNDIEFKYLPDGISLDDILSNAGDIGETHDFTTVFEVPGPCIFNGSTGNITGSNCTEYANQKMINTGIYLLNNENIENDFLVSFTIDSYVPGQQEVNQTTIINSFLERNGALGYGFLLRRANNTNNVELIMRDGNNNNKTVNVTLTQPMTVRFVKKGNKLCYSINNSNYKLGTTYKNFDKSFDVPVTFGGSINSSGEPFRYIKGTLSNMTIKMGTIDEDIVCE